MDDDVQFESVRSMGPDELARGMASSLGNRVRSEILAGLEEDVSALVGGGQDGVRSVT